MLEQSTDENILNIITKPNSTDEEKLEMLRSVTEENKDNHTAHLIHIEKVIGVNPLQTPVPPRLQEPKGTFVTPEFSATTLHPQPKRRNLLPWLLVVFLLVIIAAGASYFLLGNKENKSAKPDSTKIDSAKGRSAEKKKSDALIENTSLQPVSPQRETSLPASAERQPQGVGSKPAKPTNREKPQTVADDKPDAKKDEHIVSEIFKSRKGSPKEEKQTSKFNAKKK